MAIGVVNGRSITPGSTANAFAVTPADATVFPNPTAMIYVGTTGNLVVTTWGGNLVTFTGVPAGAVLHIAVSKVMTATTASNIVAMY